MPQPLSDEQKKKLRSVNQRRVGGPGTTEEIIKDEQGSKEIKHWDGRQDAVINPAAVVVKATPQEVE